jgi:mono/diheme cytochrome c family protein
MNRSAAPCTQLRRICLSAIALAAVLQACSPQDKRQGRVEPTTLLSYEADTPAAYRGAAIAAHVCAQCHNVTPDAGAGTVAGAPSFLSVANRPGTTYESLSRWLTASHPTMPNYVFNQNSVEDLSVYIMTLRSRSPEDPR